MRDVLERAKHWPAEAQKELADIALEMEGLIQGTPYEASPEELQAIDEAERSGIATPEEVEEAFAAFRRR